MVVALSHTIVFWHVHGGQEVNDSMLFKGLLEVHASVFTTSVGMEPVALVFVWCNCNKVLEHVWHIGQPDLAPKVMHNEEYTEKANVYSFGIILFELHVHFCLAERLM